MKYIICFLLLISTHSLYSSECKDFQFFAEYEYSKFDENGEYKFYKGLKKLPKKWNDNDDVYSAIVLKGSFLTKSQLLTLIYKKDNSVLKSSKLSKSSHNDHENYYPVNKDVFLSKFDRPLILEISLNDKCKHVINIGDND